MAARFSRLLSLCLALLFCLSAQASLFSPTTNNRFVPADQAFVFDFQQNSRVISLRSTGR